MNSAFPSRLVGGFEVLEVPDDPYHGQQITRSCSCENCSVAGKANPMFFEYFETKTSGSSRKDMLTLVLVVAVSAILFCIISNINPK